MAVVGCYELILKEVGDAEVGREGGREEGRGGREGGRERGFYPRLSFLPLGFA